MALKKRRADCGTKELQEKRSGFCTLDPLSKLKRFGLISEDEFEAGNWYRFLYVIKYRNPFPSSVNFNQVGSVGNVSLSGVTLKQRLVYEGLFKEISEELNSKEINKSSMSTAALIRDVCVFGTGLEKLIVAGKANSSVMVNFKALNDFKNSLNLIRKRMFVSK